MKRLKAFVLMIIFLFDGSAIAYDSNTVHPKINEEAVRSAVNLNNVLVGLGYAKGIDDTLSINATKRFFQYFRDGGINEDVGIRAFEHFHDPTKTWDNAGLKDSTLGDSSLFWAQNPNQSAITGTWSWPSARTNYYHALIGGDKIAREQNFADMFRALGQVMHLLADASVPEHTRNDIHVFPWIDNATQSFPFQIGSWTYETWCKWNSANITTTAIALDYSITNVSNDPTLIPISNFWDTTSNSGYGGTLLGLAEYTNYNFLSNDTIFKDYTYPVNPQLSSGSLEVVQGEDGVPDTKVYFSGTTSDSRPIQHLVSTGYLWADLNSISPLSMDAAKFSLDDNCFRDYASILVPKAVGYSAGLLNYFFRGELGVKHFSNGIKVKNLGMETMSSYIDQATQATIGTITVFYDDSVGTRTFLADYDLTTPLEPGEETDVIYFAPPSSNISPKRYIVVFRGKLGNEEGAVIGKVAESSHIYYVAMDGGLWKIFKIEADGTNQSVVYENPFGYVIGKIATSPDGNTLAISMTPDGLVVNSNIYLLSLIDTNSTPTVLTTGNWPGWSPDGTKIVFERDISPDPQNSTDRRIFVVNIANKEVTPLYDDPGSNYSGSPAWSPVGNTIAYSKTVSFAETDCSTNYVISLMDTAGNSIGSLTCPPDGEYMTVGDFEPVWGPDGQEIAFTRTRYVGRASQLHKVNVVTKVVTKLTDSPDVGYDEFTPAWSLDEMSIAIGSMRDGDYDIWLVDPHGAGYLQNISNSNPDIDGYPAFGK